MMHQDAYVNRECRLLNLLTVCSLFCEIKPSFHYCTSRSKTFFIKFCRHLGAFIAKYLKNQQIYLTNDLKMGKKF